jgi:trehalose-6-phosphate synthase
MGLRVIEPENAVLYGGRVVWVRSYPVSIDVDALKRLGESSRVREIEAEVAKWRPEKLIVRVDRTDPAKNLIRGFLAYEQLLEEHPEYHGRVALWAFLQPSRQDVSLILPRRRRAHQLDSMKRGSRLASSLAKTSIEQSQRTGPMTCCLSIQSSTG